MRLVATRRTSPGTRLGRDIPAPNGGRVPLLRAGVVLTQRHLDALVAAGINAIYVDDEISRGIEVPVAICEETRREAREALDRALTDAAATKLDRPLPDRAIDELSRVAAQIASEVADAGDAALALADLAGADAYTLEHSIDVTVIGLLIANRLFHERGRVDWRGQRSFDRIDHHLAQLGAGLLLHDIGKIAIPSHVLHKPGPLDEEEWALMRRHPLHGIELLPGDRIGARAKSVVRSHHERWDGTGYPDGLAGEAISQFARIAAVADVFDAVTSERPYANAAPQHVGVGIIRSGSGEAFDPEVVEVFCEVVPPYPPGAEITLADGRRAVVVSAERGRFDTPRVRIFEDADGRRLQPYEVDLRDHPELAPHAGEPAAA
jgi:HD-GYP domain-containing protein (c-di-GMP phosphodiesterase class II)